MFGENPVGLWVLLLEDNQSKKTAPKAGGGADQGIPMRSACWVCRDAISFFADAWAATD
jgi:hypothetical protein